MSASVGYEASAEFVRILELLQCTLMVSVYMQDRVVMVSATSGSLHLQAFDFPRPMGVAARRDGGVLRVAVAGRHEVVTFSDEPLLATGLPGREGEFSHLLAPRSVLFTGDIDAHDLVWVGERLFAANTHFSCVAEINASHSFVPTWRPPFVSRLMPEDRCHLNGLTVRDGRVAYVTAFSTTDTPRGWSADRVRSGVLIDTASAEVVLGGLCTPHSPRAFGEALYVLESGRGLVLRVDAEARRAEVLAKLPGFTRGMDLHGDILFVGLSRIRDGARVPLPIQDEGGDLVCGVAAIERRGGRLLGWLRFDQSYTEVFDVKVLSDFVRGGLLSPRDDGHTKAISPPGRAFWLGGEPDVP